MNHIADEIEVKFFDINLSNIRQKLVKIGGVLKTPERLMKRVVFGGEANPEMMCTYGRVRDEGSVITMSAKYSAKNGDITSQKEAQVTVSDFDAAVSVLKSFGLKPTNYQESRRETWQLGDGTLVELETWPDLPGYIEIEGDSIAAIKDAAAKLGLDWSTHTTDSTDKLYASYLNLDTESTQAKLSNLRF